MTKIDGRKLSHEELEKIRIAAVKRVQAGESPELVIKSIGFHRSCIYDWLSQYQKHGEEGLKAKPITGRPPKLTEENLNQLIILLHKNPSDFGIEKPLWDRDSFKQIIEQEFQVKISKTGVSRLLAKLGIYSKDQCEFTNKSESISEKIAAIKLEAKKSKEVLYFFADQPITTDSDSESPNVFCLSAITAKGDLRFKLTNQASIGSSNDEFLDSLKASVQKPIRLVTLEELQQEEKSAAIHISSPQPQINTQFMSESQTYSV